MDSGNLNSYKENYEAIQENGAQKISISDQILNMKSDSFTVDMEPFSHLTNKDLTLNSRINLQRSLSRKVSHIGAEKKMNTPSIDNEREATSSPRAAATMTMPEKSMLVTVGATDQATNPQVHHQITIMTGGGTTTTNSAGTPTKSRLIGKRSSSFKQSSIINPRRILFFFATLSSIGSIILICFTLSMAKYNGDDNSLIQ